MTAKQLEQYADDIARAAEKNGMRTEELIALLRKDPGKLNLDEANLVDDVFRRLEGVDYRTLERAEKANINNINDFINGTKNFDDVLEDYTK